MLSDHSDSYKLHADSYTRSRVITYFLDLSSWIHGAVLKEERSTTMLSDHSDSYKLHADSYTRSRVITYFLDLSSWIHGAVL